jgi:hypothetical protein
MTAVATFVVGDATVSASERYKDNSISIILPVGAINVKMFPMFALHQKLAKLFLGGIALIEAGVVTLLEVSETSKLDTLFCAPSKLQEQVVKPPCAEGGAQTLTRFTFTAEKIDLTVVLTMEPTEPAAHKSELAETAVAEPLVLVNRYLCISVILVLSWGGLFCDEVVIPRRARRRIFLVRLGGPGFSSMPTSRSRHNITVQIRFCTTKQFLTLFFVSVFTVATTPLLGYKFKETIRLGTT